MSVNENMEKLIIIDSCMRAESRTKVILAAAKEVLSARWLSQEF